MQGHDPEPLSSTAMISSRLTIEHQIADHWAYRRLHDNQSHHLALLGRKALTVCASASYRGPLPLKLSKSTDVLASDQDALILLLDRSGVSRSMHMLPGVAYGVQIQDWFLHRTGFCIDNERARHQGDANDPQMFSCSIQTHAFTSSDWHLAVLHKYSSIDEQGSSLGTQSRGSRVSLFNLSLHKVSLFVHHSRLMDTQYPVPGCRYSRAFVFF